jgi:TetR/AcrR family transcriptional regulator, multidrug resistance operon repressor
MNIREKILNSALKLFVERGIDATPTSAITKDAGVSTGILFHYFYTKEDLIQELYSQVIEEFMQIGFSARNVPISYDLESFIENARLSVEAQINWELDNWNKFLFIRQFQTSPQRAHVNWMDLPATSKYVELFYESTKIAVENRILKPNISFILSKFVIDMVSSIAEYLHDHPEIADKRETWDDLWSYYWDAISFKG